MLMIESGGRRKSESGGQECKYLSKKLGIELARILTIGIVLSHRALETGLRSETSQSSRRLGQAAPEKGQADGAA